MMKNPFRNSKSASGYLYLKKKHSFTFIMLFMIIILVALHLILYIVLHNSLEQNFINAVRGIAASTARTLENDLDRYLDFIEVRDVESDFYIEKNRHFAAIKASGDLAYVYTTRWLEESNTFEFILDGEPVGSDDWSAPGDEDEWDSCKEYFFSYVIDGVYTGPPAISTGIVDLSDWGALITAYAPVLTPDGQIVSLVGVDISSKYLTTLLTHYQILMFIISSILLFIVWTISRQYSRALKETHERQSLMLDTSPLCTQIWNKDLHTLDCNEAGVRLYGFKDKLEYTRRFITECSPEFQPDGQRSGEKAVALVHRAFEVGHCQFEWMHRIPDTDEPIPAEVTLVRAKHKNQDVVIGYTRDLREYNVIMRTIEYGSNLMQAVNQVAVLLLDANAENFNNAVQQSMRYIAEAVSADCIYLWKNHIQDDELLCSQIYEWSERGTVFSEDETLYKYNETFPGWEDSLANGEVQNGPVSSMPVQVQEFLAPGGIISILVIPIFINERFWGFIGFDDNKNERFFTKEEESILNSASLLIAGAFIRNEMYHDILSTSAQLKQQSNVMEAVNQAALILLNADLETFEDALQRGIAKIAGAVNIDCIYIWENKVIDGELYCYQLCEWSEKKTMFADSSLYKYDEVVPGWEEKLSGGDFINSLVRNMTQPEQDHLTPSGILSIFVAPIFLEDRFWGFVGFDDCQRERIFTNEEESILHSASLIIANSFNRNKIIRGVQETSEEIKSRDKLLQAVNEASVMLLTTRENDDIETTIKRSLELVGSSMSSDRIYIWKSSVIDDELHHTCIYGWDSDTSKSKELSLVGTCLSFKQHGNHDWDNIFLEGGYVNNSFSSMSPNEQAFLTMFEIKAVAIVPIFLDEQLWGVFCIGDCNYERVLSEEEIAIMRSMSLMMASAINRQALIEKRTHELALQTTTLMTLFDSIPDPIFTKDLDLRYVNCNKAFLEHIGLNHENIIGKKDGEWLGASNELIELFGEKDRNVIQENRIIAVEEHVPNADGASSYFETTRIPLLLDDEIIGIVGIARDITERKKQEANTKFNLKHVRMQSEALAKITMSPAISSGNMKAAADSIVKDACIVLQAARVEIWQMKKNQDAFENISCYNALSESYEVLGDYTFSCQKYEDLLRSERLIVMNGIPECEALLRTPAIEGDDILCAAIDAPIRIDGELVGVLRVEQFADDEYPEGRLWRTGEKNFTSSLADLMALAISGHERRMARDEATAASQAKSDFLANMSHEIRTPMNVIVGLTELMMDDDSPVENPREYLQKINSAGTTLVGLINDILDISKIEAQKFTLSPTQYEIAGLLNDIVTINMVRIGEKPISFVLEIENTLPVKLYGDDLRVKQILTNILSNAFKYTRWGSVTLSVGFTREDNDILLSFAVKDTGIGMRREDLQKLFTDYNQVDTHANRMIEGTGLGLSISKGLTELMGGSISVESEYGKGSTFRVSIRQGFVDEELIDDETIENLKKFRYDVNKGKTASKLVRPDLSHIKVLVVDDSPTNLDVARGVLGKYKMKVDCVTNGQDALDRIKLGEPVYDAIFMDHMMPGMDGIETTKLIREHDSEYARTIPVIALTANAVAGTEQMFLDEGFQAFVSKPISIVKLDVVIRQWIMKEAVGGASALTEQVIVQAAPEVKPTDGIPGVNMRLGRALYEDDEEIFIDILTSYAENIPSELEKLHGVTEENLHDYAIDIHTVKGASSSIGAKEIAERAKKMEAMAKAGDLGGVVEMNEQFIKDAEILVENIKEWLSGK
jgi:PAS domain S-box-containing protein